MLCEESYIPELLLFKNKFHKKRTKPEEKKRFYMCEMLMWCNMQLLSSLGILLGLLFTSAQAVRAALKLGFWFIIKKGYLYWLLKTFVFPEQVSKMVTRGSLIYGH